MHSEKRVLTKKGFEHALRFAYLHILHPRTKFPQCSIPTFSIGSTGDREFDEADEEEGEEGVNGHSNGGGNGGAAFTAIDMFLAGLGLSQYSKIFRKHQVQ